VESPSLTRNRTVDALRTLGIVFMVVFHFIFDLKYFGYHGWDIPDGVYWNAFRNVVVGCFMTCVGIGLAMSTRSGVRWPSFSRRILKLVAGAALVSIMSRCLFPEQWIYFGVLHFIALASLVSLPLAQRPRLAAALGSTMILMYWAGYPSYGWPIHGLEIGLPNYTQDFVSPSPWFGVVWLGIALAHTPWLRADPLRHSKLAAKCTAPGRHSLLIYLLHQPLLFGLFHAVAYLS